MFYFEVFLKYIPNVLTRLTVIQDESSKLLCLSFEKLYMSTLSLLLFGMLEIASRCLLFVIHNRRPQTVSPFL